MPRRVEFRQNKRNINNLRKRGVQVGSNSTKNKFAAALLYSHLRRRALKTRACPLGYSPVAEVCISDSTRRRNLAERQEVISCAGASAPAARA